MKCPSCGKRFEVEHKGETLEKSELNTETVSKITPLSRGGRRNPFFEQDREAIAHADYIDVQPVIGGLAVGKEEVRTEVDTYLESYTCKNCGYQWTEKRVKEKRLG